MDERALCYLKEGTLLDERYRINYVVSKWISNIIYFGTDETSGDSVVIKEFFPFGIADRNHESGNDVTVTREKYMDAFKEGKRRFIKEGEIKSKFSETPGILSARDYFEENDTAYIVMDYLEGITLEEYINQHGSMEAEDVRRVMTPVIQALDVIHTGGYVHWSIEPGNIMLVVGGGVKLMGDYTRAGREILSAITIHSVLKPGYASPEQYQTHSVQGPWTDIYALCAVIYKCLTGRTPEPCPERVADDQLKSPSELGVAIPEHMERALMKGMSLRIRDRYQSVREFCADFYRGYDEGALGEEEPEKTEGKADKASKEKSGRKKTEESKKNGKALILVAVAVICAAAAFELWLWRDMSFRQDTEIRSTAETQEDASEVTDKESPAVSDTGEINDSWEEIADSVEDGTYAEKYSIGDTKDLDLGSEGVITMEIVAMDTDDLADGSGKAALTWIAKEALRFEHRMNPELEKNNDGTYVMGTGSIGGWKKSEMRSWLQESILPLFPSEIAGEIKTVKKTQDAINTSGECVEQTTKDKIWIPSYDEVCESDARYYEYFQDKKDNRIRKKTEVYDARWWLQFAETDDARWWWLRSADHYYSFDSVYSDGASNVNIDFARGDGTVVLGFCM